MYGTIKDDIIPKVEVAYFLLKFLLENKMQNLCQRYNLEEQEVQEILNNEENMENENILEVMYVIARKRGAIMGGNRVDEEKVENLLLEDFRSGKLGRITLEKP